MEIQPNGYDAPDRPEIANPFETIIEAAVERARRRIEQSPAPRPDTFTPSATPPDIATAADGDGNSIECLIWGVDNWDEANFTPSDPSF
jgi:hypothetical protein